MTEASKLLRDIEAIEDENRILTRKIDHNGEIKNKMVRKLWDISGGFQEGDTVISKHGKKGIVARISTYKAGHAADIGSNSTYHPLKKDGTPAKSEQRMYSFEEWKKV